MSTAIMIVSFFLCLFGALASIKSALKVCRTDGRGTWWGGPAFATGMVAIPFAWGALFIAISEMARSIFPVQL